MNKTLKLTWTYLLKHKFGTSLVIAVLTLIAITNVQKHVEITKLINEKRQQDSLLAYDYSAAGERLKSFLQKHGADSITLIPQFTQKQFDTTLKYRNTKLLLKSPFRQAWVVDHSGSKKISAILEDFCIQDIGTSAYVRGAKYQELNACLEKTHIDSLYNTYDTTIKQLSVIVWQQRALRVALSDLNPSLELRDGVAYFIVFRYRGEVVPLSLHQDTLGTYIWQPGFARLNDGSWHPQIKSLLDSLAARGRSILDDYDHFYAIYQALNESDKALADKLASEGRRALDNDMVYEKYLECTQLGRTSCKIKF